jgi:S-adenosylmethionine decarboxylase
VLIDAYSAELYGCRGPLNDVVALENTLRLAAERVGAHVVAQTSAAFQPHGATVVLVLAESHLLVATWPEHNYAMVDLLLCNDNMDPEEAAQVVFDALLPETVRRHTSSRNIGPTNA